MMIERTGESTAVHPPLYFALLRGWTSCFGDSEWGLRSLSAVAGVLTIVGACLLAREGPILAPERAATPQRHDGLFQRNSGGNACGTVAAARLPGQTGAGVRSGDAIVRRQ